MLKFDKEHYLNLDIDYPTTDDLLTSCRYLYRARWIQEFIKDGNILDLGCNNGLLSLVYAYQGRRVVGIDLSKEAIRFCNRFLKEHNLKQAKYTQGSIEKFKSHEKFSNIFLCEVIEHVENPIKVLKVAEVHLKTKGRIFLTTPEWYGPYGVNNTGDDAKEHLRIYKARKLKKMIEKRGKIIDFQKKQLLYVVYQL